MELASLFPEGIFKNLLRKAYYRKRISQLNNIDVTSSGYNSNYGWIEIDNHKKVWGYKSRTERDEQLYKLLSQSGLDKECFSVLDSFVDSYVNTDNFDKEKFKEIETGNFVVEVGSCLGHYTIKLSDKVGSSGQVISIEADPENFEALSKNKEENNLSNVDIFNAAIGEKEGEAKISEPEGPKTKEIDISNGDSSQNGKTTIRRLDSIIEGYDREIDLLIVTVNGWEASVIKSTDLDKVKNIVCVSELDKKE